MWYAVEMPDKDTDKHRACGILQLLVNSPQQCIHTVCIGLTHFIQQPSGCATKLFAKVLLGAPCLNDSGGTQRSCCQWWQCNLP
jgi:hypothetical protein